MLCAITVISIRVRTFNVHLTSKCEWWIILHVNNENVDIEGHNIPQYTVECDMSQCSCCQ